MARRGEEEGPPVSGRVGGGRGRTTAVAKPCSSTMKEEEALPLVPGRASGGLSRAVVAQRGDEVCGRVGDPLRRRAAERRGVESRGHSSPGRGSSWVYAGSGSCGLSRALAEAVSRAVWAAAASRSNDHHASAKSLLAPGANPSRRGAGGGSKAGLSTVPNKAARVVLGAGANVVK